MENAGVHHRYLWVEAVDRPGQLGAVATVLGAAGIDILAVDVHPLGEANAVSDRFTVRLPSGFTGDLTQIVASASGARLRDVTPVDPHDLVDDLTRMLRSITELTNAQHDVADRIARFIGTVVEAELVDVVRHGEQAPMGLVERAARQLIPMTELGWVQRLPGTPSAMAWSLAAPQRGSRGVWVALLSRSHRRFTPTETSRLQAALSAAVLLLDQPMPVDHPGR
jgi:hypothetical protein